MKDRIKILLEMFLDWADKQLAHVPSEDLIPQPVQDHPTIQTFRGAPNIKMRPAPLGPGEGGRDTGDGINLKSGKMKFYFNILFKEFLNKRDRWWSVPLMIKRIVPILAADEYLCGLIDLLQFEDPKYQWGTYLNHISNDLVALGIAERFKDKRGICWYKFTDDFLISCIRKGWGLKTFLRECLFRGARDSSSEIMGFTLGLPPAHSMVEIY